MKKLLTSIALIGALAFCGSKLFDGFETIADIHTGNTNVMEHLMCGDFTIIDNVEGGDN